METFKERSFERDTDKYLSTNKRQREERKILTRVYHK